MIDKTIIDELANKLLPVPGVVESSIAETLPNENLRYLLTKCNGGYSKDRYIHFFGTSGDNAHRIDTWNSTDLWKKFYPDEVLDYCFFAEDVFGNQFGYKISEPGQEIFMLWVHDGLIEPFEQEFHDFLISAVWGTLVFEEMRDLAERFQKASGQTAPLFHHLAHRTPILLGGNFRDTENLEICKAVDHLRFSGQVVTQCRSLPPGTRITDVLVDKNSETLTLVTG